MSKRTVSLVNFDYKSQDNSKHIRYASYILLRLLAVTSEVVILLQWRLQSKMRCCVECHLRLRFVIMLNEKKVAKGSVPQYRRICWSYDDRCNTLCCLNDFLRFVRTVYSTKRSLLWVIVNRDMLRFCDKLQSETLLSDIPWSIIYLNTIIKTQVIYNALRLPDFIAHFTYIRWPLWPKKHHTKFNIKQRLMQTRKGTVL